MARYVALVDGRSGSYGLTVPDLPGCTSAAATIDEVLRKATEAVRLWAEDALADGEKLPSHARSRRPVPIPKWLRHWRAALCSRLCRSSSTRAVPLRQISRWTLACSPQSTRQRPRAD
jgi:predicted RNase H-like HicB family nuclease